MHLPDSTAAARPAVRKFVALVGAGTLLLALTLLGSIGGGAADAFPGLGGGHSHGSDDNNGSGTGGSNNGGTNNGGSNGIGPGSLPGNNDPDDDDDDDGDGGPGHGGSSQPNLTIPKYTAPPTSDGSPTTTPRSRSGSGGSSQWSGGGHPKQSWEKDKAGPTAPKATAPEVPAPIVPAAPVAPAVPPAAANSGNGNGNAAAPKPATKPHTVKPHAANHASKNAPTHATPKVVVAPEPTVTPPVIAAAEIGDFAGGVAPAALLILGSAALLGSGRFLDAISAARS
ncbi:hypothetical protein [Gordonia sp. CPCC 205333]|uniref:hypothetical protein n=1 Tax=Gordonia sp. CPCC 205333 TaxID=3140790 RepID=UPI003AF39A01